MRLDRNLRGRLMMMFADDAVVSGESREHVGETRGTFYPDGIATFKVKAK